MSLLPPYRSRVEEALDWANEFRGAVSQLHSWLESADRSKDDEARCPSAWLDRMAPRYAGEWARDAAHAARMLGALVGEVDR